MTAFVPINGNGSPIVCIQTPPDRSLSGGRNHSTTSPPAGPINPAPTNRGAPPANGNFQPIQATPMPDSAPPPPPNFNQGPPLPFPPGNLMYHHHHAPLDVPHLTLQSLHERIVHNEQAFQERYDILKDKHNELRTEHVRLSGAYDKLDTKIKKKASEKDSGIDAHVEELERRVVQLDRFAKKGVNEVVTGMLNAKEERMKAVEEKIKASLERIVKLESAEEVSQARVITALHEEQKRIIMRVADSERKLGAGHIPVHELQSRFASMDSLNELATRVWNAEQSSKSSAVDDKYTRMLEQMADLQRKVAAVREDKLADVARRLENQPNIAALSLVEELSKRVSKIEEVLALHGSNEKMDEISKQHHDRLLKLEQSTKVVDLAESVATFDQRLTDVNENHERQMSKLQDQLQQAERRCGDESKKISNFEDKFDVFDKRIDCIDIHNDGKVTAIEQWRTGADRRIHSIEHDNRLYKLSASSVQLDERTGRMKEDLENLEERVEGMRSSIAKISTDSLKNVKAVGERLHELDKKRDQQLGHLDAEIKVMRLMIDRVKLQQRKEQEQEKQAQPATGSLADEIRLLRRRIEEGEPSDEARREVSYLFQTVVERSPATPRRHPSSVATQASQAASANAKISESNAPTAATPAESANVLQQPSVDIRGSNQDVRAGDRWSELLRNFKDMPAADILSQLSLMGLTRSMITGLAEDLETGGADSSEVKPWRDALAMIEGLERKAKATDPSDVLGSINTLIATHGADCQEKEEDNADDEPVATGAERERRDEEELSAEDDELSENDDDELESVIELSEDQTTPRRSKRDNLGHMKHHDDVISWAQIKEDRRAEKRRRIS